MTIVPNEFPRLTSPNRVAIIGEAPGKDEVVAGKPFVGASGRMLTALLAKAGIVRGTCFIGNVCQHRPPNNDISEFDWGGPEITHGLQQLAIDLKRYKPNICLLLGQTPLIAFKGEGSIGNWRGSLFMGGLGDAQRYKCLTSYHPADCLRQYEWTTLLMFDIKKAHAQSKTPDLVLPSRTFDVNLSAAETIDRLETTRRNKQLVALDIEGGINSMSCISFAPSANYAFIVPLAKLDGSSYWAEHDEREVWRALTALLEDPDVPKVLQNSLYDRFVLQYSYNVVVRGVVDDTMLKHWELYCELEKSLGFQASLYTDEPFYKSDRKTDDRDTFYRYCCRDSAVTYEINQTLNQYLEGPSLVHYRLNIELLNPLLYMELRGIRYNTKLARTRLAEVNNHIYRLQFELDKASGVIDGLGETSDKKALLKLAQSLMCYKRDSSTPKKQFAKDYDDLLTWLLTSTPPTPEQLGHFTTATKLAMNTKSPAFKTLLYDTLQLPKQWIRDPATKTKHLSANYESLLKLKKHTDHPVIPLALDIGELRTRSQMLAISADTDGRVRCGYNLVGTETGRLTCYTSPTGSGYNLQTIPSKNALKPLDHPLRAGMRDLFIADDGCWLFQCDLSGADGWTVAAWLAKLGDATMLLDYKAGVKPAKRLCYNLRHGADSLKGKTREEVKELTKEVKSDDWDYFACKIGQHGTSYLMGARKLADTIFVQSEGRVSMSERETRELQSLFLRDYNILLWHNYRRRELLRSPVVVAASGHSRRFFGRPTDILGQALAHEPQANTTYATNLAAWRLWNDSENRRILTTDAITTDTTNPRMDTLCSRTDAQRLRIEPLHQVHDALIGQFRKVDTTWAVGKVKSYFDNPIEIAGQRLVIPFEGSYGPSWGELTAGSI